MSYIAILGRQPGIGLAELERLFGMNSVSKCSEQTAIFETDNFDIQRVGGVLKAGKIIFEITDASYSDLFEKIREYYTNKWSGLENKITLGISAYDFKISARDIQSIGLKLKHDLKKQNVSLRLVPNNEPSLSTATSHHNKLGLSSNKIELIIVNGRNKFIVAESTGAQNITSYANRDQARPKRDAFVGMLPPKLAQIMINLAHANNPATILDPFCGTGVILQEALLMGYSVYGSDLSDKMIDYSKENIDWLSEKFHREFKCEIIQGDATKTKWNTPIDAVVCETYLGQPFSAPPSNEKLDEVRNNCNHIITEFLKNIHNQINPGTKMCIAVPAWRNRNGSFSHLPIIDTIGRLGYKRHEFKNISQNDLLYFREDQVVARELLVLEKV